MDSAPIHIGKQLGKLKARTVNVSGKVIQGKTLIKALKSLPSHPGPLMDPHPHEAFLKELESKSMGDRVPDRVIRVMKDLGLVYFTGRSRNAGWRRLKLPGD